MKENQSECAENVIYSNVDDATKAELKWTLAMADNNIPFRFSDTFSDLLPKLCPEFKIAVFLML